MKLATKALIASASLLPLTLLVIPLQRNLAETLLHGQRTALETRAMDLAAHLSEHPLVKTSNIFTTRANGDALYAAKLRSWVDIDGDRADFGDAASRGRRFDVDDTLEVNRPYEPASFSVDLATATEGEHLFLHAAVTDEVVVYRQAGNLSVHRNDHVQLAAMGDDGVYRRYTIAPHQPGPATAFLLTSHAEGSRAVRPDENIEAYWQATAEGFNVEIRLPLALVSNGFSISATDVDDPVSRQPRYRLGSASTRYEEDIGHLVLPSPALDRLLASWSEGSTRLTVVDSAGRLLAEAGDLTIAEGIWQEQPIQSPVPAPALAVYDRGLDATALTAALSGTGHTAITSVPGQGDVIYTAIPIEFEGEVKGAFVAAERTSGLLHTLNEFRLALWLFALALVAGAMAVVWLVTRHMSRRLITLQRQISESVDPQGRIRTLPPVPRQDDEIGALGTSFHDLGERLRQYNRYLEELARRLAHELRTPVTVVRSSLDNLAMTSPNEEMKVYLERAQEGVERLSRMLANMTEATRLEESLDLRDNTYFDIADVVRGCVSGYEAAWPDRRFELAIEDEFDPMSGLPELVTQMLDKLVSNALDFAIDDTPVRLRLVREGDDAVLRIMNEGPPLPTGMQGRLFESMVSVRGESSSNAHLGLGLYIARVIAEFHGGTVAIDNRVDTSGVVVTVRLPLLGVRPDPHQAAARRQGSTPVDQ